MMPVYMDSYPHQRNQVPFPQYSGYDGIPYQMMVDQAKFPVYGPWPGGSNYGYIMPCHACSNHGNFPAYYSLRPPFSHFTPSPSLHSCGHHPVFTEPYPGHYSFPPRPPVEQLRYEYDKDAQRDYHCCGCPNHTCNWRSDKGVKIEEQEPDIVKKSDPLVPVKNSPYPIMWIPHEYMKKNNEYGRPFESEMGDKTKISRNMKSHEKEKSSEKEPRGWNGWFPLDSLKSLMQDEDGKSTCNQQNEDKMSQFPYPIIWMPSDDVKEEAEKDQRKMNGWFPLDMNGLKSLMQGEDDKGRLYQQNEDKTRQFPYPIIWMPSDDVKEEAEKEDQRKMNSWFPLDMNGLKSLMQGEDDKGRQNQQNEDKTRQLPHPIIWMPSNSWQEQTEKDKRDVSAAPNAEDPPSNFKFIPVKTPEIDDSMSKPANKKNSGVQAESSQMMENNPKINLVKKADVHRKEDNTGESKETSDASSKYAETMGTHSTRGSSVRKQSSPQKTSRLLPVCLRVEPLSRKKSTNGSSRSPSPPGFNGRLQEKTKDASRFSASSSLKGNTLQGTQAPGVSMSKSEDLKPRKAERKVVDMVDGKTCETKNEGWSGYEMENSDKLAIDCQEDMSKKSSIKGTEKDSDECKLEEDKWVGCERDTAVEMASEANKTYHPVESADVECRRKIKNLSDVEAAMLIQSAYRGFVLRKMEPLKKLKQITEVREQVAKVRKHLQALESSDLQKNARERDGIGEMIMRLLLELDTIQGLHPSLRDIRKSLARELIALQEKLDSLVTKKSEETTKPADDPSTETHSDISMQEMQNKEAVIVENSFETSGDNSINVKEQEQDQLSLVVHLESSVADKEHERCENEIRELAATGVESKVAESAPNMESKDKAANGEHDADQVVVTEREEKNGEHPDLELSVQLTLVAEEKMSPEGLTGELPQELCHNPKGEEAEAKVAKESDAINVDDNLQVDELRELPLNLIDEEPAVFKLEKNELVGDGRNEIVDGEMESNMSSGQNLFTDVGNMTAEVEVDNKIATTKEQETNLLPELPLGVIKNDSAVSAFEKHIQIQTGKNEALCGGEVKVDKVMTSQEPETNLLAELPIGVIEDDSAVSAFLKHEKIETGKIEALCGLEASHNVAADANAQMEAEDLAKFMLEELPANAVLEVEEIQPVSLVTGKERSDEVGLDEERNQGMIDDDHMPSLELAVIDVSMQESEEIKEGGQEHKANGKKEQVPEKKAQCEEPRCVIDHDKVDELPSESESESTKQFCAYGKKEQVPEKKAQCEEPRCVIDNDKVDELPSESESESTKEYVPVAMHIAQTSIDEGDMIMEREKKLIEENARLREMMDKLMEAGKDQVTVISNLTGRVKDLERKLSRKKKQRARRYKKSPLTASATKIVK